MSDLRFLAIACTALLVALLAIVIDRYTELQGIGVILAAAFVGWWLWGRYNGFPPSSADMERMIKEENEEGQP